MKLKQIILPITLILLGLALTILGALFKIQRWQFASELLTTGMLLKAFAILFLAVKLILHAKRSN